MGIPVWVSRDIVMEAVAEDANVAVAHSNDAAINNPSINNPAGTSSSVESILQDLNQQTTTAVAPEIPKISPVQVNPSTSVMKDDASPAANEIARTSSHIVYGSGNLQADWMVIGESPEINDNRQNQPYAGEPGVLLCNMLRAVGLENPRESAYLVNVIKSSMQAIESPSIGELNQILSNKILEIKPKIVLVVGQLSAQNLLQSKEPLARLRAKAQKHPQSDTNIVVTYYPSYLLSKPMDKRKAWDDLKLAMQLLLSSGSPPE